MTPARCLSPETIAAYLDRRLGPEERVRAEEHLADCAECRTLMTETAAFLAADAAGKPAEVLPFAAPARPQPAPATRRRWAWPAVAAAAALLALTPFVLRELRPTPESALRDLDRALAGKRYIEARLSGFEYGEYVAPKRGALVVGSLPLEALAAGGKVERLASNQDTAAGRAALGASLLALRLVDDAIEYLEAAARLQPNDARIQSDLAAAHITRFRAHAPEHHPGDPAKAVEAATRAVALDPRSRAAAFNRALALELLPRRAEAIRAWEAYLALDASSGWANEARSRLDELRRSHPAVPPSPSAGLDGSEYRVPPARHPRDRRVLPYPRPRSACHAANARSTWSAWLWTWSA